MALKFKINDLESVDEKYRDLYTKSGDGNYQLAVDGVDDVDPLKRAKQREKEARKQAEQRATELEQKYGELKREIEAGKYSKAKDKGDVEALEKSWQEKLNALEAELSEQLQLSQSMLQNTLIDSAADQVASIFVAPKTQRDYVKSRLTVEIVDGKPVTRVLDEDGKPTAKSLDEFKAELKSDPELAPVIVGSAASGSGASGGAGGGAPAIKDLSTASISEKVAYMRAKQSNA